MYPFKANYMVENYGDDHGAGFYSEDETVKKHRCRPKYKYRPWAYMLRGYDYFNLWGINCNNRLCSFGYRNGVRKASLGAMTAKYKKIGKVALIVCFAAAISVCSASSVVVESFHAPSNLSKVLIASFDVGVTLCLVGVAGYEACLSKFYEEPFCKCSSWKWAFGFALMVLATKLVALMGAIFYHSHHAETIMTGIGAFGTICATMGSLVPFMDL